MLSSVLDLGELTVENYDTQGFRCGECHDDPEIYAICSHHIRGIRYFEA